MSSSDGSEDYPLDERQPFMGASHRAYFRGKLLAWKTELLKEGQETLQQLQTGGEYFSDVVDRAICETARSVELRARDRQRKLLNKIDAALRRIDDGTYGYCTITGEPINLRRLDARPIATLSVEAQEAHERYERAYREL